MNYYAALLIIVAVLGTLTAASLALRRHRRTKRLATIERLPFPEEYASILERLPHYGGLDDTEREAIRRLLLRFIHTKEFVGIGIGVETEMRVVIAFYAALLLLHKTASIPYPHTHTILIYPDSLLIEQQRNDGGIVTDEEVEIDGQSADGTVVITWDAARDEAFTLCEANLILHEFAHEIDFMSGQIDGIPPMDAASLDRWTDVFDGHFDRLYTLTREDTPLGDYDLFGEDAALDEAEFFAVATERFFGVPDELAATFPDIYDQLHAFYGLDPLRLFRVPETVRS